MIEGRGYSGELLKTQERIRISEGIKSKYIFEDRKLTIL